MPSLLEGQIDVLGRQLQSLTPQSHHSLANVEQAIVLLLFLYEQIFAAEQQVTDRAADDSAMERKSVLALYDRWLYSADLILPMLRERKSLGHAFAQTPILMKACLRARGVVASARRIGRPSHAEPLDEVQRELQGRA